MIVCLCHRISDRDIARAVREGTPPLVPGEEDQWPFVSDFNADMERLRGPDWRAR